MNNTFSIKRFGSYASTELRASRHFIFTIAWVTAAVYIGILLISILSNNLSLASANNATFQMFVVGIGITWVVLISGAFKRYHNSMSAPLMLTLPVSTTEKFSFIALYYLVLIPTLLYGTMILLATAIGNLTPEGLSKIFVINSDAGVMKWGDDSHMSTLIIVCSYLLGAVVFRRAQFILSSVSIIVILFFVGLAFIRFFTHVVGAGREAIELNFYTITYIIFFCITIATLFLAWLRFRSLQLKK